MEVDEYLSNALVELEGFYLEMACTIEPPVFADVGGYSAWRYKTHTESLACYLKGAKVVSTLNACMALLRAAHVQEIGALCRMIDDYCNEIFFLLVPQDGENFSKDQLQFLEDFFSEEFNKPMNPLGSEQKRKNVPARKIHATFGKIAASELNPSDAQEIMRTLHQTFSGYVHGAYPHIMEMYGDVYPQLNGMPGTPRVDEWRRQLTGYVYRAIMVSVFVARKLGLDSVESQIREFVVRFETEMSCKPEKTAEEMVRDTKSGAT